MAILRKSNKQQFTSLPQGIFRDKRLSLKDVGLLVSMLALPDDWEFSENGLEAIFEHDGQASIRTGLKNLEKAGYLKRVRERDKQTGKITACNWYLYDYPHFENPHLENPSVDNPSWGNPPQSITKESITKESTTKESKNKKSAEALPSIDAASLATEFDILWKLYPRKEGKSNALKDYTKARKDKKNPVSMEEVQRGIERYIAQIKAQGIERRFIKQGSTWFHQRCWEDEYQGGNTNGGTTGDYPKARVGNYI